MKTPYSPHKQGLKTAGMSRHLHGHKSEDQQFEKCSMSCRTDRKPCLPHNSSTPSSPPVEVAIFVRERVKDKRNITLDAVPYKELNWPGVKHNTRTAVRATGKLGSNISFHGNTLRKEETGSNFIMRLTH
ncbi:hypothetical protein BaRGS_00025534 [Batillaria attramentaria]|uniref:Uncharacterized protein n=1 Tax=Batillaria attramentaria TaxID=370345 RepID=A0ABD0K835_9CAEN